MKTLLIGNFGARNIGDELILAATLEDYPNPIVMTADSEFSQNFCEKKFDTISPFPTGLRSFFRFLLSKKYRLQLLSLRGQIGEVVFPGGGLFAIKSRAYLIWGITFLWVRKLFPKIKIILEHQGVDKPKGYLNKKIVQYVFSHTDQISARDDQSANILGKLGIQNVEITGDLVATFLQKKFPERSFQKQKIILVNARTPFNTALAEERFPQYKKIFVAFEPADARHVPENFEGEIIFPHTARETFKLFQTAEIVIGQRLHFLILAEFFCGVDHTFTLGKPYSEKVENFVQKTGILPI